MRKICPPKGVALSIYALLIRHSGEVSKRLMRDKQTFTGGMSNALYAVDLCQ
jgi:hypothetical protein